MNNSKTATLTCRIDPELKEALRTAANNEHRSIANMIEVLILNYCKLNKRFSSGQLQKLINEEKD